MKFQVKYADKRWLIKMKYTKHLYNQVNRVRSGWGNRLLFMPAAHLDFKRAPAVDWVT